MNSASSATISAGEIRLDDREATEVAAPGRVEEVDADVPGDRPHLASAGRDRGAVVLRLEHRLAGRPLGVGVVAARLRARRRHVRVDVVSVEGGVVLSGRDEDVRAVDAAAVYVAAGGVLERPAGEDHAALPIRE